MFTTNFKREQEAAFTLAEVLITLAIIGVVAAMTIPTLITKMSERAANARKETIEARLLDGINRYSALEDGLSQHYETTYDFLVGLSKHYKMAQICKADEITNCIPYDVINYDDNNTPASIEVKTLTDNVAFFTGNTGDNYLAPASFITAQGTPVIMAFKKDCAWDMGKAMRDIADSGCIAYMYDESGAKLPNKYGADIVPHGLTITGKGVGTPIATVGGVKIMEQAFFQTTGLTSSECEIEKAKNYGISYCTDLSAYGGDRWAAAMQYCHDKEYRLPNEAESLAIVKGLFKDTNGNHPSNDSWSDSTYKIDLDLAVTTLSLKNYDNSSIKQGYINVEFWSTGNIGSSFAYRRNFRHNGTGYVGNARYNADKQVLCISD